MIQRFRSKALKLAFAGNLSKLTPAIAGKIVLMLDILNAAQSLEDIAGLPDFHALKGDREGEYSLTVTGNWRLTFTPVVESVTDPDTGQERSIFHVTRVDYEDYH